MGVDGSDARTSPAEQQLTYAGVLAVGVGLAFILLIVGAFLYFSGAMSPALAMDALPRMWTLPTREFIQASGMQGGWSWITKLNRGDILALGGIALLAAVPVPCLVALIPGYVRRRDWTYLAITLGMIGTLLLAGSGVFRLH